jgi:hypothetical protein
MGMDVYGLNPKTDSPRPDPQDYTNKNLAGDEWEKIQKLTKKQRDKFYNKKWDWEHNNKGVYFRNNVWWWRPLWDYCKGVCPNIITEEKWEEGHHNSGCSFTEEEAIEIGDMLNEQLSKGFTIEYEASYKQWQHDLPQNVCSNCNNNNRGNTKKKDCAVCNTTGFVNDWNKSYPFNTENVKEFAEFCINSGGFKIC